MPASNPEVKNASGLTPSESKALSERQPNSDELNIIKGIKELYSCKPQDSTYSIYAKNAVFHDPIGYAEGVDTIRAQFDALPKLFPRADIPKFRVLSNPASVPSSTILIDQDVSYFRDPAASSPTKTLNSLLTLERDASGLVIRHTEEWDHKREKTAEDGFWGMLQESRKKVTANITELFSGKK